MVFRIQGLDQKLFEKLIGRTDETLAESGVRR